YWFFSQKVVSVNLVTLWYSSFKLICFGLIWCWKWTLKTVVLYTKARPVFNFNQVYHENYCKFTFEKFKKKERREMSSLCQMYDGRQQSRVVNRYFYSG